MGPSAPAATGFVPFWGQLRGEGPKSCPAEAGDVDSAGDPPQRERKRPAALQELGLLHEIKPNVGRPEWLREKTAMSKGDEMSPASRKRAKRAGWGISLEVPSEVPPVEVLEPFVPHIS